VSFTDLSMLSRTYELRSGVPVDRNREFVALGIANVAAGLPQSHRSRDDSCSELRAWASIWLIECAEAGALSIRHMKPTVN
jgi:hypothetical protein